MDFRDASVSRLQVQYDRLQRRIDTAYEDRLDGGIAADFFERRAAEWRKAQTTLRRRMDAFAAADQAYIDQGIALLELARRAVVLYERQNSREKRRLLDFLHLNSFWDGEHLETSWRKPFDILVELARESRDGTGDNGAGGGGCQVRHPRQDSNL